MSKIALEGKNRLPSRVQDLILDVGMTVTHAQHGSSSNETLASLAKNYVSLETCVDNTAKSLEKMKSEIEKLEKNASFIEKSLNPGVFGHFWV
uniref:BLOC-1-related complex subunit 7 n=1 Tax=Panagrellus redivivus TaxID=6233 RepID=A0A7E4VZE1_PANRE